MPPFRKEAHEVGWGNTFSNYIPTDYLLDGGQVPKRRGPKPDSKPALTRRQELNRQAQR